MHLDLTPDHDVPPSAAIDEAGEFVATLMATPPGRLTQCAGWTAHELIAHLAAGAAEEADLIEAHLSGCPDRPTRGFVEREAPFRALADAELRARLFEESLRLAAGIQQLGSGSVAFTGSRMGAADLAMHTRSECALHRWDLVGRDDVGWAMLRQPELTRHAAAVLTSMRTLQEALAPRLVAPGADGGHLRVVVRSAPHDDLVIDVRHGVAGATLSPPLDEPADLDCDPAQRLLLLWGRREPSSRVELHATGVRREAVERLLHRPG